MPDSKEIVLYDHKGDTVKSEKKGVYNLDPNFFHSMAAGGMISVSDVENNPYKYHPWIFACAWTIVKNVSRLPLVLYNEKDENRLIKNHPVLDLLQHPNVYMTRTPFIQAIVLQLLLPSGKMYGRLGKGGQSFLVCLGGESLKDTVDLTRGKIPDVIIPYGDNLISPTKIKTKEGTEALTGWKFELPQSPGSNIVYGTNEIIRVHQFNPYNWMQGLAQYHPAQIAILQDVKSDVYNTQIFDNNAIPAGVLSTESTLNEEQMTTAMKHWYETYGGFNTQKIAVLGRGLKYQHIGFTNADMQYQQLKDNIKDQVIAVFGLNKIALGMYEKINRATIIEGRRMLWQDAYLPIAETIEEALNSQWIRYIDKGLRIKFDTSNIEALKKDYSTNTKSASELVDKVFLPPIVACRIAGVPLSDEDIKKYPWLSENPADLKASGAFGALDIEQPKPKQIIKVLEDERDNFWKDYVEKVLDVGEKKFQNQLIRYFYSQRNKMQDKVDEWQKANQKAIIKAIKAKTDDFMLNKNVEDEKLFKLMKPVTKAQLLLEKSKLEEELGALIEWNVTDETVDRFVSRRKKQLRGINTTTFKRYRNDISDTIRESMRENWTVNQTAKEIKKVISETGEVRKNQSKTIARTEIGTISSTSRFEAFKVEGFQYHQWITAGDEKVRDNHRIQGESGRNIARIGKKFRPTGLRYPLDPEGDVGEIINCRCVVVVVEGK